MGPFGGYRAMWKLQGYVWAMGPCQSYGAMLGLWSHIIPHLVQNFSYYMKNTPRLGKLYVEYAHTWPIPYRIDLNSANFIYKRPTLGQLYVEQAQANLLIFTGIRNIMHYYHNTTVPIITTYLLKQCVIFSLYLANNRKE